MSPVTESFRDTSGPNTYNVNRIHAIMDPLSACTVPIDNFVSWSNEVFDTSDSYYWLEKIRNTTEHFIFRVLNTELIT